MQINYFDISGIGFLQVLRILVHYKLATAVLKLESKL